jgi:hypothetical protein
MQHSCIEFGHMLGGNEQVVTEIVIAFPPIFKTMIVHKQKATKSKKRKNSIDFSSGAKAKM